MKSFYRVMGQPHGNKECKLFVSKDNISLTTNIKESPLFGSKKEASDIIRKLEKEYSIGWEFFRTEVDFENDFQKLWTESQNGFKENTETQVELKIESLTTNIKHAINQGKTSYFWRIGLSCDDAFVVDALGQNCKLTKKGELVKEHFEKQGLSFSKPNYGHDGAGIKSWNDIEIKGWA